MTPLPLVISLPHCSCAIPAEIVPDLALDKLAVRREADLGTAEIFLGLPVLEYVQADWCRLVVDLNRDEENVGEKGVVATVSFAGSPVFKPGRAPAEAEKRRRVQCYYRPYHQKLERALDRPELRVLLDCHAMDPVGPPEAPDPGQARPEVVLGSRHGETCNRVLLGRLAGALSRYGFEVGLEKPYSGGFITQKYGETLARRGLAAVQIELNKRLFLDMETQQLLPEGLERTRRGMHRALMDFAAAL